MESFSFNSSFADLVYEDINADFGKSKYLDHEVIIMKSNGYINISKLCTQYGKQLNHWKTNKQS